MEYFWVCLLAINVVAVIICICDKSAAVRGKWRVSEKMLFLISLLGGAPAMYVTMRIIRHKTKHNRFMIGLPLIILVQTAIALLIYTKFS